jgi:hypothetical protein
MLLQMVNRLSEAGIIKRKKALKRTTHHATRSQRVGIPSREGIAQKNAKAIIKKNTTITQRKKGKIGPHHLPLYMTRSLPAN